MSELFKIRDVSARYNVTARTLRYYEEMGLLKSTRAQDSAYRMYDDAAIVRLKQILTLRKLNIGIADIKRVFAAEGSQVLLEVLDQKIENIDDEVALLHELRDIVKEFIREVEALDFAAPAGAELLYEKASEIARLVNVDYEGAPSKINRLSEISAKLKKVPVLKVVEIPKFRAVSSGYRDFEEIFGPGGFNEWQEAHMHLIRDLLYASPDFLTGEDGKMLWLWAIRDGVTPEDTAPYDIIDFEGGLYAVGTSIDEDGESSELVRERILKWIGQSGFESDSRPGHREMGHMVTPTELLKKGLGYHQMDIYWPIRVKGES